MRGLMQMKGWFTPTTNEQVSLEQHLDAAADWLARGQDAGADDGVAAHYDIRRARWSASYPETTGYIIPTLYQYAARSGREEFLERATRMAHWECDIQLESGAVRAGTMDAPKIAPTIFNTGQVMFGWSSAYEQTGDSRFAESLRRAGDWLVAAQDEDGAWRRFPSPFVNRAHALNTYNTRVAFALARAALVLDEPRFAQAAANNVEWALTQIRANGWIENNDLEDNERPLTHTIAYAIRGILEVGVLTAEPRYIEQALCSARAVADTQRRNGALPGRLDCRWQSAARWSCLTGNVQMAINWLRLSAVTNQPQWRAYAERCIAFTKSTQSLTHSDPGRRGGIAGSSPIRGEYMRYCYPNCAANFFMTAILLLDQPQLSF